MEGLSLELLDAIADQVRQYFDVKNRARDQAIARSRELIRQCALSIRAVHRGEYVEAEKLLSAARSEASLMVGDLGDHPDLYHTGYTQDALKELAEAAITHALITNQPLPTPQELQVLPATYLNGLGEAVGELRRYILDVLRHGRIGRCEQMLQAMEDVYSILVTIDYPDALTGGLRRTTDMVRGVLERTRGDLTLAARQEAMQQALHEFEKRVAANDQGPGAGHDSRGAT
jgi:translin